MATQIRKKKPLARVKMFLIGNEVCAWIGRDDNVEAWEVEPVWCNAPFHSDEWYMAAFTAACEAFRRLQDRLPGKDLVWSTQPSPVGSSLYLSQSITRYLLPYVAS